MCSLPQVPAIRVCERGASITPAWTMAILDMLQQIVKPVVVLTAAGDDVHPPSSSESLANSVHLSGLQTACSKR